MGRGRSTLSLSECASWPKRCQGELFGHVGGIYGSSGHQKGLFEIADGRTIFLDEIAEISLGLQAKLCCVCCGTGIHRSGDQPIQLDVRVIAATNKMRRRWSKPNAFVNLFYRLNVVTLHLPPCANARKTSLTGQSFPAQVQ
jgi:two-component system nitrogen regulation response regulator NtrX